MTYLDEGWSWLEYASDTLRAAKDNYGISQYSVVAALAYFAAFRAAEGVIAFCRERDPKTHAGVIGRFGDLAVRGSDFPPHVGKSLSGLFSERIKTDYDHTYRDTWGVENTAEQLRTAETFVEEVHNWVGRHYERLVAIREQS